MEVIPKNKGGRPSKYKEEYQQLLVDTFKSGGHISHFCSLANINPDTFHSWISKYPEFEAAYKKAKMESQAFYETILLKGALGQIDKFNFNALAMILNNKFRGEYTRNASGSNTEINIGTLNSVDLQNPKIVQERIEALLEKLGDDSE